MKLNKKILSAVLSMGILASAGTIFAEDVSHGELSALSNVEVTVDGTVDLPVIKVTLPTSASFIIDPFNAGGNGQIASTEFKVINESEVAVDVILNEFKAEIKGDIVLGTSATISPTSTKKDVFLRLEAGTPTGEGGAMVYPEFDSKAHAKRIVKVGKGLNEKLGTLTKGSETAQELALRFNGAVNHNVAWTEEDGVTVTPVFKISPQIVSADAE